MRRHLNLFATATRYDLIEHARNRFACLLVVFFIPTWITLVYLTIPDRAVSIRLASTGETVSLPGSRLTQITGALNAVTLVTGFMMFAATFSGGRFDRRLAMAGYPRTHLVLAKTASLTLTSAVLAAYATAVIRTAWTPERPGPLAAALFGAALTYGALGVVFGSLLRREVEGMFALVMTSVIDVGLQNPVLSSGAGSTMTRFLPTYGAVQVATAAGFSSTPAPSDLALQTLWFAAAGLLGLLAFHHRTRNALPRTTNPRTSLAPMKEHA
ncbi:ABC transporter permease [Streptomyces dangxiongensis]|uniref:ABC transporter permease n=1 Tax=Streptomyces dangxiongensis TaxID=1442032 RepID=A0A3G2JN88_9ACTN|nr:ABC transporter permease [Streptomyces dangxiongensis]AYN43031.1 ABC transporter permease [Streptomyces dangxiongensis]